MIPSNQRRTAEAAGDGSRKTLVTQKCVTLAIRFHQNLHNLRIQIFCANKWVQEFNLKRKMYGEFRTLIPQLCGKINSGN